MRLRDSVTLLPLNNVRLITHMGPEPQFIIVIHYGVSEVSGKGYSKHFPKSVNAMIFIDISIVKAHRKASGSKKGEWMKMHWRLSLQKAMRAIRLNTIQTFNDTEILLRGISANRKICADWQRALRKSTKLLVNETTLCNSMLHQLSKQP